MRLPHARVNLVGGGRASLLAPLVVSLLVAACKVQPVEGNIDRRQPIAGGGGDVGPGAGGSGGAGGGLPASDVGGGPAGGVQGLGPVARDAVK